MSNLSVVTGNTDPILVLSATGTGASATTFVHDSAAENNYPGQLFPSVFEFAITDIVGVFSGLAVNLEWSPITATGTPQFQTVGTWTPLVSPVVFFPCSATGTYRLNVTSFVGGTSFNVYASIASSMPQGSGGGGGGGSVTQGTVPWVVSFNAPQHVIVDSGGGGGVQYADNAASGATPTGTLASGWDSVNSKVRALKVDASQNLLVALNAALPAGTNVIGHVVVDSFGTTIDVSDRAARLLGVVYGSQAQQLKQTATNFNLQVELAAGGTLYDARQIRALTSADIVTAAQGSPNTLANKWPVQITDGTNTMPTGDAISRALFQQITDGTNGPVAVKAASTAVVAADKALVVGISPNTAAVISAGPLSGPQVLTANSTNTGGFPAAGALDSNILSIRGTAPTQVGYLDIKVSDGTNGTVAVKVASTGAANADQALVVSLSPNSPIALQLGGSTGKWGGLNLAGVNAGYVAIVDSTGSLLNPAVKAASTAAIATDPALVVALSPNTPLLLPTNAAQETGGNLATIAANTGRQATTDVLMQILAALDAVNFNLGKIIGDYTDRFDLQTAQGV